ncbi:MAG: RNA polymerase sigma factor [Planctomycetota bacterium]|jgi:RNA polymerase sigma factor (sigma-70 family)
MSETSKAEKYLLEQIRRGNNQAWSQLVERYQGRLMTFARAKLGQRADCEDVVQETFIAFVKGLADYRGHCGLETYLFAILRRKLIDSYRRKQFRDICLIQDVYEPTAESDTSSAFAQIAGPEHTGSWYVRRDEQHELQREVLAEALSSLVNGLKKALNFRDLEIVELLFYCRLSNRDVAGIMNLKQGRIGLIKHRCLKQVRQHIAKLNVSFDSVPDDLENLLKGIWQWQRLSCPKRSTIGAYLLETLDADWRQYVDFHLNRLGCNFCRANLQDLQAQTKESKPQEMYARIMESTVGFLRKP